MNHLTGETVRLALSTLDAHTAALPLAVLDANGNTRPLQPYERLIIDSLEADVSTAAGYVDILDMGAAGNNLLASFSPTATEYHMDNEGVSLSIGTTPTVSANATGFVEVVGSGRVTLGKSIGTQAGYQALLTPAGNVSGQ